MNKFWKCYTWSHIVRYRLIHQVFGVGEPIIQISGYSLEQSEGDKAWLIRILEKEIWKYLVFKELIMLKNRRFGSKDALKFIKLRKMHKLDASLKAFHYFFSSPKHPHQYKEKKKLNCNKHFSNLTDPKCKYKTQLFFSLSQWNSMPY